MTRGFKQASGLIDGCVVHNLRTDEALMRMGMVSDGYSPLPFFFLSSVFFFKPSLYVARMDSIYPVIRGHLGP